MERYAFRVRSEEEMRRAGATLATFLAPGDVVSLTGDLGAGKTCLTQGIAEGLGVGAHVTSPTFNILVRHEGRLVLNHFDLYRLERAEQLEDIDFYETVEADGVSVIEWGERFARELPPDHLTVTIAMVSERERELIIEGNGPRSEALARSWATALEAR